MGRGATVLKLQELLEYFREIGRRLDKTLPPPADKIKNRGDEGYEEWVREEAAVAPNPELYGISLLVFFAIYFALTAITLTGVTVAWNDTFEVFDLTFDTGPILMFVLILLIAMLADSFVIIGENEFAAWYIFSLAIMETKSGLYPKVPIFMKVVRQKTGLIQEEFPGDPDKVRLTNFDATKDELKPIVITSVAGAGETPYDAAQQYVVFWMALWRLQIGRAIRIVHRVGDSSQVIKFIEDKGTKMLAKILGGKTLPDVLASYGDEDEAGNGLSGQLNKGLKEALESVVGIDIEGSGITRVIPSKTVNEAAAKYAASMGEAQGIRVKADASAHEERTVGTAKAEVAGLKRKLEEKGTGEGIADAARAAGMSVPEYMALVARIKASENAGLIIDNSQGGQIGTGVGLGVGMTQGQNRPRRNT